MTLAVVMQLHIKCIRMKGHLLLAELECRLVNDVRVSDGSIYMFHFRNVCLGIQNISRDKGWNEDVSIVCHCTVTSDW
jgi:hypothetical protein